MKNLYKILGVNDNATQEEIKKAHRSLAKQYHPDAGGDDDKFKEIQGAYDVLSNEKKRDHYDNTGEILGSDEDRELKMIIQFIAKEIIPVIAVMETSGSRPIDYDKEVKKVLSGRKRKIERGISEVSEAIEEISKTRDRYTFKGKNGDDVINGIMDTMAADANRAKKALSDELDLVNKCADYINDNYEFKKADKEEEKEEDFNDLIHSILRQSRRRNRW